MNKLIPLVLVLLVLGGGAALAFYAYTAKESYAPLTTNGTAGAANQTPRNEMPEAGSEGADSAASETGNDVTNAEVLHAEAEELYQTVIDREQPLRVRRPAAIALAKHPAGAVFVERIVRNTSFVREAETEDDPEFMVDMNVLIALFMNIRYDTTKPVLVALTNWLDDQRTTRMLRNDWDAAPPEEETSSSRSSGSGSGSASGSGSGSSSGSEDEGERDQPERRERRTGMTSGVGGVRPRPNSVELREYAMMALERALDARLRYNAEAWRMEINRKMDN